MKNKKISIRLFIVAVVLMFVLQISTSFAETGKATASDVRVRKSPSTNSDIIELLAVNDVVEILGREGDWYKVSYNGKTGYVSQAYISVNGSVVNQNNTTNANTQETANTTTTTAPATTPSTDSQANNQAVEGSKENASVTVETGNVYKVTDKVQVNILPTITSEYIGEIKADEEVSVISKAGMWAYVKANGVNGWIRTDKIATGDSNADSGDDDSNNDVKEKTEDNTENSNTEETNNTPVAQNYTPKTMYTSTSAVNVRQQSNTSSDIVTSLGINTQLTVIGEENGWSKVEINGNTGYIRNDLLSAQKTEITSRSNGVDRSTAVQNTVVEVSVSDGENTYETNTYVEPVEQEESSVPVSSSGVSGYDVAEYAKQFLGYPYVYAAAGPYAFDCSGFTMYVYQHFGYSLSHASRVQATQGVPVSGELQPGDILVFSNDGVSVGHVGLYLGNDQFIHASTSTTGVIISNLHDSWNISKYWGARRIL